MATNLPVTNPADLVNVALRRLGSKLNVGNLYDGSEAAQIALDIYGQTRDALLRQLDPGFAQRNVALTLLKTAPTGGYIPPITWTTSYPPLPWFFEYAWPADCLKVRAVKPTPIFVPVIDPQPCIFDTPNDNALVPPARVIVCNVENALCVYTGQVTDLTTWDTTSVQAFIAAMERGLAPALKDMTAAQIAERDEMSSKIIAETEVG